MLGCFVSDSDFRTERRSGAKPVPALTIAAAAVFAFPLQWGEHKDSSAEDKNTNDSGTAETRDGCAAFHHKTTDYGHEDMNCLRKAAYPGRTTLHAAMLIGRGLGVLQQYFIRVAEQLECANRSVFGGYLQAKDAAHRLWFALQHHLKIVGSAVNQAGELVRLSNEKACGSCGSETMQAVMQAVQGSPSPGKQAVREKDTDGECNIFSGRRSWTAHGAAFYRKALVGSLAAECSSGLQFHPGQPTLFDAHAAYNENEAHKSCGWLMATYNALASFFRTLGSALLRLIYVLPLGITAAIAGFWLLGLPYISACLRTVGLGGNWEAIAQRELEEVIFTAVTAAASAAGPTYVKFLQWIATRPDLFHESLCARCARLQTSVRPFSYPRAALLLREQFGDDVGRHLLLDPTPIGCGCIAQVYRAYLLLSNEASEESKRTFLDHAFVLGGSLSKSAAAEIGRGDKLPPVAVAVKIMRPGVREAMEFDLRMMLLVASVLQYLPAFGFVALKKSVEEFAVAMRRQLDFGLEEKHLKLFRSNFGLSTVPIPGDLLPLRNKCRRASGPRQCETPTVEPKAANYHTNIVNSLSRKILGMRRQVTFPYPFEALSSSEVIVMTLESGFTLNQLFKTRAELQELEEASRDQEKPQGDRGLAATRREQVDTPVASPILAAQKMIEFSLQEYSIARWGSLYFKAGLEKCVVPMQLIFPVLPATLPPRLLTEAPRLDGPLELVVLDCGLAGSLDQADRVNFVTLLEAITRKRGREAALAMLQRAKRSSCQDREGFCSEVEQLIDEHHFEIVVAMSVLEGVGAQLCPDADVLKTALPYSLIAAKLINPDSNSEASH
ncbi:uncharacterized protein EMH_0088790 [Eimeria mitis]|uniref:ABC1 atypical kinase-like domain-containing protein n=1 Tax=Eimeria mitis TaxID=44415 RepID=U6JQ26_9EIME|nr:uncharacterized protein EMH_0088790 [Eimeria mitis]CDJ27564.1 hypothetical protein, conserved [Eimeria mitis]